MVYESQVPVGATPEYMAGQYMLQGASSFLPVMALAPQEGEQVVDMAAAPGGKTTYLSALLRNTGMVFANEINRERLKSLTANLQRMGATNAIVCNYDGRELPRVLGERSVDRVLLDAPCSGTGTLRRHPDIAWLKDEEDVGRLTLTQDRLLLHAVQQLKPGALLVYAVCSLQEDEGLARIEALLARDSRLHRVPVQLAELPGLDGALTKDGDVRTLPSMWPERGGLDGFYVARLTL